MKFGFSLAMLLVALSLAARAEVLGTVETEQDDGSRSVIEILDEPQSIGKCDGAYAAAAYVMDHNYSLLAGKGCWKFLGSAEILKLEIVLAVTEEHLLSGVPLSQIKFAEDGRSKFQYLVGQ